LRNASMSRPCLFLEDGRLVAELFQRGSASRTHAPVSTTWHGHGTQRPPDMNFRHRMGSTSRSWCKKALKLLIKGLSMATGYRIVLSTIPLLLLAAPSAPAEFTYREYAKEPEIWKRGYVFAISRYVSVVAQPDEEPPYPLRETFHRCLANATDN